MRASLFLSVAIMFDSKRSPAILVQRMMRATPVQPSWLTRFLWRSRIAVSRAELWCHCKGLSTARSDISSSADTNLAEDSCCYTSAGHHLNGQLNMHVNPQMAATRLAPRHGSRWTAGCKSWGRLVTRG